LTLTGRGDVADGDDAREELCEGDDVLRPLFSFSSSGSGAPRRGEVDPVERAAND
jgi:hypothetical protein